MKRREFLKAAVGAVVAGPVTLATAATANTAVIPDIPGYDMIRLNKNGPLIWTVEGWETFGRWMPDCYANNAPHGTSMFWPNGKARWFCMTFKKKETDCSPGMTTPDRLKCLKAEWTTENGRHTIERRVEAV